MSVSSAAYLEPDGWYCDLPLPLLRFRSTAFGRSFRLAVSSRSRADMGVESMGALAKATGFEISSSMLSSIPQKREKGSSVSGARPKLMYDSPISVPEDEDDECKGDRMGSAGREEEALRLGAEDSLEDGSATFGRIAKGGSPRAGDTRVAVRISQSAKA